MERLADLVTMTTSIHNAQIRHGSGFAQEYQNLTLSLQGNRALPRRTAFTLSTAPLRRRPGRRSLDQLPERETGVVGGNPFIEEYAESPGGQ